MSTSNPNPTGGDIGQATQSLMEEIQKSQAEARKLDEQQQAHKTASFAQTLQQVQEEQRLHKVEQVQQAQQLQAADKARKVLSKARDLRVEQGVGTKQVGATETSQNSKLNALLKNLINGQDKMNEIMKMALSGRQFSPAELVVMQAGVYRFSQELDLTSKVIDKATGSIKQTMNTQV